jgi:hypothetical protein
LCLYSDNIVTRCAEIVNRKVEFFLCFRILLFFLQNPLWEHTLTRASLDVRRKALATDAPIQSRISENKRIQKYTAKFTA